MLLPIASEYVFFDGERVARKDFSSSTTSVFYYFSNHLKSLSVITDSVGAIREDEDYYPWGGELQFVNNDSDHYKFTGKERDSETQLELFRSTVLRELAGTVYYSRLGGEACGGALCSSGRPTIVKPECGREVNVNPDSGEPRDWDINHDPKWSERTFDSDATRQDVIDNYQDGTELKCVTCNRADNQINPPNADSNAAKPPQ